MPETSVILVVEDSENDILLMHRGFEKAAINNPVQVVRTGEEAVAYLSGEGKYNNRAEHPLPAIIFLDLKLPGMDGFALLSWIRQQDGLRSLPVIVLTSSNRIPDVNRAYQLGANSFFVKEIDFHNNVGLASMMHQYWLQKALTPESFRPAGNPAPRRDLTAPSTSSDSPSSPWSPPDI